MSRLLTPLTAATVSDPYPYYAKLLSDQPLAYDPTLGMWLAVSAEAVSAVLTDSRCLVRPLAAPVPTLLRGTSTGEIFSRLVRMIDGPGHTAIKQAVSATLASIAEGVVTAEVRRWAHRLIAADERADQPDPAASFALAVSLPASVVGSLLGIPNNAMPQATRWLNDFVQGLSPATTSKDIQWATIATDHLRSLMDTLLSCGESHSRPTLLHTLRQELRRAGYDDPDLTVTNAIGVLFQTYEATAGLIGNTLLALGARPELRARNQDVPDLLEQVMAEVLRFDPPIQNTRRFVATDSTIAGQHLKRGDTILVLLAAANRDPAVNDVPDQFVISREDRRIFSFGVGAHACPGAALALMIARTGVAELHAADRHFRLPTADVVVYRPSINARVPIRIEMPAAKRVSG